MDYAQKDGGCLWMQAMEEIKAIQKNARENNDPDQTEMANDRSSYPKGMDRTKGSGWTIRSKALSVHIRFRSLMDKPEHLQMLKDWLVSYHPEELFDENGKLIPELEEH